MKQDYTQELIENNSVTQTKNIYKSIYPWFIFILSSAFLFYKYLLQVSPSVMVEELMRTFSLTGESMGNLAAFYFYAYLVMQLPVGLLLDNFSPRRLVSFAVALCACGAFIFSAAHKLGVAELGRLLIGLGGAFSAVGTMKLITLWFPPRRFALVSGLMMTVGMLGAVGGEAPLSYFVSVFGWRQTLFFGALLGFLLAAIVWLCVRDKTQNKNPTDHAKKGRIFLQHLQLLISNKQNWLIAIYSGLAFAPITAFAGLWGVPYLEQFYHVSRADTAALVSLIFIGFALGSPLSGWLSDRIARRKSIMAIGTSLGLVALLLILYGHYSSLRFLGFLLFCFGFFTSFFFVSFATIREINPIYAGGTAIGFINMFNAICGAFSEPMIGEFLDLGWQHQLHHGVRLFSNHDYQFALMALPAFMLTGLITLLFVKETYCKQPL